MGVFQEKNKFLTGKHVKTLQTFLQILLIINLLYQRHSVGVAEKASLLANYMGFNTINTQKVFGWRFA